METILDYALKSDRIYLALFVALFIWVLMSTKQREEKYTKTIEENQKVIECLSLECKAVEEVKADVKEVKADVRDIKTRLEVIKK